MLKEPDFCLFTLRITDKESVGRKIIETNKIYPLFMEYHFERSTITYNAKEACLVSLYDNYMK